MDERSALNESASGWQRADGESGIVWLDCRANTNEGRGRFRIIAAGERRENQSDSNGDIQ